MVRNGFTRKKVDSLTLGEKLKKLRVEGRISLNEISKHTKIQAKYLEYLENGEYDKLPADVYVKGFLRSYAHYLGVSENSLIKLYEREQGIKKNIRNSGPEERATKPVKFSNFAITPRMIVVALIIMLAGGSFFYLYKELNNFISTPRLAVAKPIDGSVVEGRTVYVNGVTERDSKVFINDQPTLVNDKGEFNEQVGLQEGLNTIVVRATNRFEKETVQTISVRANYQEEIQGDSGGLAVNEDKLTQKKGIKIEIYVQPSPTWISVETDGNLVYSGTLLPQAIQTFEATDKISITSGKGNNTYLKINGNDKGVLSESPGVVRDVTFTANTQY